MCKHYDNANVSKTSIKRLLNLPIGQFLLFTTIVQCENENHYLKMFI